MLHHFLLFQLLRKALEWCATEVEHDNASKLILIPLATWHLLFPLAPAKLRNKCQTGFLSDVFEDTVPETCSATC